MAGGWVKSLQCKSRAFDDVFNPTSKHLISGTSCRKSAQSIKDVIEATAKHKHHKKHHARLGKPKPEPNRLPTPRPLSRPPRNPDPLFPALTELPEGHPSRNVVEIIFHTSWINKCFSGRVEMIFKVQNGPWTVSRFEEYREAVKSRAGLSSAAAAAGGGSSTWEENARCVADGNEMMRFHCLGPARGGGGFHAPGDCDTWVFPGGKGGTAICTFPGSGGAHESAGGGRGRRAMLVCRVIAGRVEKRVGLDSLLGGRVGFDSVSGDNGELLVFDPRAVLPCFLIVYKL